MTKGTLRLLAAAALAALLVAAATAGAQDAKPTPGCTGMAFSDPADDQANLLAPEGLSDSTEITGGFLNHEPAKAAEATTFNIVVKSLKAEVPAGATTLSWNGYVDQEDGTRRFVRAFLDFSGEIAFEYGTFVPNPAGAGVSGVSRYDGDTTGKLFEGDAGVVQLVIPADIAKPAATFTNVYAASGQGRTLPSSTPGGQRGLSASTDTAPDGGATDNTITYKVEPCPDGGTPPPSDGTPPPSGGTPPPSGPATLPVKVAGKVKAPRRKSLAVKLSSTETITNVAAQVRKGTKVVGRGKMARLARKGTLKLRLSRKLKKGKYTLDLAGNRENGQRGVSSLSLRLR